MTQVRRFWVNMSPGIHGLLGPRIGNFFGPGPIGFGPWIPSNIIYGSKSLRIVNFKVFQVTKADNVRLGLRTRVEN